MIASFTEEYNGYIQQYNGPKTCNCDKNVYVMYDEYNGCLISSCSVVTDKLVTLNRKPTLINTGKKRCDFRYKYQIKAVVQDWNVDDLNNSFSGMCVLSDDEIAINELMMCDDNNIDRNRLLYHYKRHIANNSENNGSLKKRVMDRVKRVDNFILTKFKNFITGFMLKPTYDDIGEMIWTYRKYVDPTYQFKRGNSVEMKDTVTYILHEYKRLKKEGFKYVKPSALVVKKQCVEVKKDTTKGDTLMAAPKGVVGESAKGDSSFATNEHESKSKKIDIFKKIAAPSERYKQQFEDNQNANFIEFSDDEQQEDDEDSDDQESDDDFIGEAEINGDNDDDDDDEMGDEDDEDDAYISE